MNNLRKKCVKFGTVFSVAAILGSLFMLSGCGGGGGGGGGGVVTGPPASITANNSPLSAVVGTAFGALRATVKDASGNPVNGVLVTFAAPASGASGSFAGGVTTATTNAQGIAESAVFTANATTGPYTVTASVAGVATSAGFALTNLQSTGLSITAVNSPLSAVVGTAFGALQATVKDASGTPVNGALVTFTAPASGASGTFAGGVTTATTNAQGIAESAVFTANGTTGSYTVTASVAGVATSADFALTNLPPTGSTGSTGGTL